MNGVPQLGEGKMRREEPLSRRRSRRRAWFIAIAAAVGAIVSGLGSGPAVALPSLCDSIPENIVSNCGFETGDFTDWTQSGNTGFTGVSNVATDPVDVHSGDWGAFFGPVDSLGFIAQDLLTTLGEMYDLMFWLRADGGEINRAEVSWDEAIVFSIDNAPDFPYTLFTVPGLFASTASTELKFGFRHDQAFFSLDDISVRAAAAVPGPSSLLLMGSGLAGWAIWWRRHSRRPVA
jgi:PEP-CTERM motif-containing protein